ncbi:helix-turn-helix domain-containing protein [Parageobacillus thermoglucosidasius]|uniref:helix-turn-helix domain-containing protein n=1 Tax=Parageobacillus thermoglucosidasius TaxID=1426 RepID=UPI000B57F52B|nr:helix-turn-helix transcriptional regulator [Parageobacillus thermoglucosidasius]MBY6270085.1 hypothetical protein [Parageobacillus thermoglucosidasius]OUM84582.1 MAG: hypothetical protein BAA00_02990 [Parageobacillus thermoglucosidasius]
MVGHTFGAVVQRERKKRGWSLEELSKQLGGSISPSYLFRIENGEKNNPSFQTVAKLIEVLELNIEEVFQSFGFKACKINPNKES